MAVNPSPLGPKPQFELSDGTPAVGNQLFFYVAGSVNTKQNTYTDSTGGSANTNPIVLNALGQPTTQIWFTAGQSYKVVYAPSTDTDPPTSPIWTIDNLRGINDTTGVTDEWAASSQTPTFISGTSFSVPGDQTSTYTSGRRVKTTNTSGTIYSTVSTSSFGSSITTVTVTNDSGVLDSGLSAISLSILRADHPSIPIIKLAAVASAVDEVTLSNAATGKRPGVVATGTDTNIDLQVDGKGTGGVAASLLSSGVFGLIGGKITRSVNASALTLAIKTHAGNDPSSTESVFAIMPSVTSNVLDGAMVVRRITAATSLVVSSGSTLGQTSAVAGPVYTYLLDNAGSIELAVSSKFFGGQSVQSSTAEGGAGGADTITTLYSTTSRSNVACVSADRWKSTQATAGTWAATTGDVQRFPFPAKAQTSQIFTSGSGTYTTPWDALYIRVRLVGAGGGGAGSGTTGGSGSNGGNTTFGTLTGNGGAGATQTNSGDGGTGTGGDINIQGGSGSGMNNTTNVAGGPGGSSSMGGGGGGGSGFAGQTPGRGAPGKGGGGGGAGAVGTAASGSGGGAGGYSEKIFSTPNATYSYAVGALGGGGSSGTGGDSGGPGCAGVIAVEESY